jgi:prepilin-type N-terminal cleavage/methylation domain-containing protein
MRLFRRGRSRARRGGFSLIEIMIAMTMLAIIMLSLAKLSIVVSSRGRSNSIVSKRTAVLQREFNKLGAMPYATLLTFSTTNLTTTAGDFTYTRRLTRTTSGTNRLTMKIVIVPATDTTKKDSLSFDRVQSLTSSLCTGC